MNLLNKKIYAIEVVQNERVVDSISTKDFCRIINFMKSKHSLTPLEGDSLLATGNVAVGETSFFYQAE